MRYREVQQARLEHEHRDKEDEAIGVVIGMMLVQYHMGNRKAAEAIYDSLNDEAKAKVIEFFKSFVDGARRIAEFLSSPEKMKAWLYNGGKGA